MRVTEETDANRMRLVLRGMCLCHSNDQICKDADISEPTLIKYKTRIRDELKLGGVDLNQVDLKSTIEETITKLNWLFIEAEKEHRSSTSPKDRAIAVRLMADIYEKKVKLLQQLGALYQRPVEINVLQDIRQQVMNFNVDYKARLHAYNLKAQELGAKTSDEFDEKEEGEPIGLQEPTKKKEVELIEN